MALAIDFDFETSAWYLIVLSDQIIQGEEPRLVKVTDNNTIHIL